MKDHSYKIAEFKLYLTKEQESTLTEWLKTACWIYNRSLDHRSKAYKRRGNTVTNFDQTKMLTKWRKKINRIRRLPVEFGRDALRRVDTAFRGFFRRVKNGSKKVGYPRFKSRGRYNSLEQLTERQYATRSTIRLPRIGSVRARGRFDIQGKQKGIRILRRAHGWYAHVLVECEKPDPLPKTVAECGIDLGLESFATYDGGEKIANPRLLRKSQAKLKKEQQKLSRCQKGSGRRKKQVNRVARLHEKVKRKRLGLAHRVARDIVNRFDRIAVEKLNVKGMARGRLSKSVNDVGWSIFLEILRVKAANAGRELVEVDPRGTSQECPRCGNVARKLLSERTHDCSRCHFVADRDVAAAMVIRQRAFRPDRGGEASTPEDRAKGHVTPKKRKGPSVR